MVSRVDNDNVLLNESEFNKANSHIAATQGSVLLEWYSYYNEHTRYRAYSRCYAKKAFGGMGL